MKIQDWFDVRNPEHIEAFSHVEKHGTWPVGFVPDESLQAMKECAVLQCVENYKIGKLNHHPKEKEIDWTGFLIRALDIVRPTGQVTVYQEGFTGSGTISLAVR